MRRTTVKELAKLAKSADANNPLQYQVFDAKLSSQKKGFDFISCYQKQGFGVEKHKDLYRATAWYLRQNNRKDEAQKIYDHLYHRSGQQTTPPKRRINTTGLFTAAKSPAQESKSTIKYVAPPRPGL